MTRDRQGNRKRVKGEGLQQWQTTAAWLSLVCAMVTLFGLWPLRRLGSLDAPDAGPLDLGAWMGAEYRSL